jgi:hypothetical protein
MVVNPTGSRSSRAGAPRRGGFLRAVAARLAAPYLDARLAAGEEAGGSGATACRSAQLVSTRTRGRTAVAVERLCSGRRDRQVLSSAVPIDWQAVEVARPALRQLAWALRSRESVEPQGVAVTLVFLTDGTGPLYRPAYVEELYEVARTALFALGRVDRATGQVGVRGTWVVRNGQLGSR